MNVLLCFAFAFIRGVFVYGPNKHPIAHGVAFPSLPLNFVNVATEATWKRNTKNPEQILSKMKVLAWTYLDAVMVRLCSDIVASLLRPVRPVRREVDTYTSTSLFPHMDSRVLTNEPTTRTNSLICLPPLL